MAFAARSDAPEALSAAALVSMMLLAVISTAAYECARSTARPFAPLVYCALTCIFPAGMFFLPLAAYDLMRNVHDASPARFSPAAVAAALAAALFRMPHSSITLLALVCALAVGVVLSARTNKLMARQNIARRTRDNLQAKTIGLRAENATLTKKLKEAVREGENGDRSPSESANTETTESVNTPTTGNASAREQRGSTSKETNHTRHNANASSAHEPPDSEARLAAFASLTEREYEVALLIAQGLDNREIAACAYMSEGTVRNHVSSILAKTNLKNRTQIAVAYYTSIM